MKIEQCEHAAIGEGSNFQTSQTSQNMFSPIGTDAALPWRDESSGTPCAIFGRHRYLMIPTIPRT